MDNLPNELIFDIGLLLPLPAVAALSLTALRFNNLLAQKNLYWKIRYQRDFGTHETLNWKQVYNEKLSAEISTVQQNGLALQHIHHQTPEICLAAVQRDGMALQFVKEHTSEICRAAVQQNGLAWHCSL
uniref:F-box domain-containing protein n=1 Tax=Marseillevirus LCMAC201 TaxID=2506605 RepID=A0A481YWS0_9VIRU|nr:MAG: protein of unknown function DUF4116 [Marseillevirus LCMAC201]